MNNDPYPQYGAPPGRNMFRSRPSIRWRRRKAAFPPPANMRSPFGTGDLSFVSTNQLLSCGIEWVCNSDCSLLRDPSPLPPTLPSSG